MQTYANGTIECQSCKLRADTIKSLEARVYELEAELTLEEQRVADMMGDVDRVSKENERLRQDLAAALALLKEARLVPYQSVELRNRIDAALNTETRINNLPYPKDNT